MPTANAAAVAVVAQMRTVRVPQIMREATSRPSMSVPSQ